MTYFLYIDGGGTSQVPCYFSYELWQDNKKADAIVKNGETEYIECHRFLLNNIPQNEIPLGCSLVDDRGLQTNNIAEYVCCYMALKRVKEVSGELPMTVRQDSQLVINQVNGNWSCKKPHLIPWLNAINFIRWSDVKFEWIPREGIVKILGH